MLFFLLIQLVVSTYWVMVVRFLQLGSFSRGRKDRLSVVGAGASLAPHEPEDGSCRESP